VRAFSYTRHHRSPFRWPSSVESYEVADVGVDGLDSAQLIPQGPDGFVARVGDGLGRLAFP
jgi:hypothetical protein